MSRILVVEDHPFVRPLLRLALAPFGDVLITAMAADALDLSRSSDAIDLVVTDIHMPGMTGVELAATLRRERGDVPVLFVSSLSGPASIPGELRQPWEFLAKPFAIADLHDRVARLLKAKVDADAAAA